MAIPSYICCVQRAPATHPQRDEKILHMIKLGANFLLRNKWGERVFEAVRSALEDHLSLSRTIHLDLYKKTAFSGHPKEDLHKKCLPTTEPIWLNGTMHARSTGNRKEDLIGIEANFETMLSAWIGYTSDYFTHQFLLKLYFIQKAKKKGVLCRLPVNILKMIAEQLNSTKF